LLQVLDDGRLTDGQGRTVDFRNAVIIMTSNLGSFSDGLEHSPSDLQKQVQEALRAHFRPEFLNRIDEIVYFRSLQEADIKRVLDIQLAVLRKRLETRKLALQLTPAAEALIAREGYDPIYGARPLKRALQKLVDDVLANALLAGKFAPGSHIVGDVDGDAISFTVSTGN